MADRESEESCIDSKRLKRLEYANRCLSELMRNDDLEDAIEDVLTSLLNYYAASRVYSFCIEGELCRNDYEKCAAGVTPQIAKLQRQPLALLSAWLDAFTTRGFVFIPKVSDLPSDRATERHMLEEQDIDSLLVAPAFDGGDLVGFFGVDNPMANADDHETLLTVGSVVFVKLAVARARRQAAQQNERREHNRMLMAQQALAASKLNLTRNTITDQTSVDPQLLAIMLSEHTMDEHLRDVLGMYVHDDAFIEQTKLFNRKAMLHAYETEGTSVFSFRGRGAPQMERFRWVEVTIRLNTDPITGDVEGWCFGNDISERMLLEEVVSHVVQTAFKSIVIIDIKHRSCTYFDPSETTGLLPDITHASSWDDHIHVMERSGVHPEDRDELRRSVKLESICAVLDDQGFCKIPWRRITDSGEIRFNKSTFRYLDDSHDLIFGARTDDTTAVRAAESHNRELESALDAARRSDQVKNQFLSQMSHDLRTPLNAIINLSALAYDSNEMDETTRSYLKGIEESGAYLQSLVNDTLDMSLIQKEGLVIRPVSIDLVALFSNSQEIMAQAALERSIDLTYRTAEASPVAVLADPTRLRQIMLNLVSNAIKYTPVGGTVDVALEAQDKGACIDAILTVRDTGIGMEPEFAKRAFMPFLRESRSEIEGVDGAGIGLAITEHLVSRMDGTIDLQTAVGKGSTFAVTIPLAKAEQLEIPSDGQNVHLEGVRVLVVEDNNINVVVCTTLLERVGCTVTAAENGRCALDMIEAAHKVEFDAILVDLKMPVMGGLEFAQRLRASGIAGADSVPLVAITANTFDEDVQQALDAGMDAYCAKPIKAEVLYGALDGLVSRAGESAR